MSIEHVYRATSGKHVKDIRREEFEKKYRRQKGHMLANGVGIPKFELLGTPAREFSKKGNFVSIEDTYSETFREIFKEICPEEFEKSILDNIGHMLFIGGGVPKLELLGIPAREFSKR